MKHRRYLIPAAVAVVVLALLVAGLYQSGPPEPQSMPEYLTTPAKVDRSRIPLGPYTANFAGLIGGPTGDKRVTFYVVMRPGDVHLQREGEVGKRLEGASVTGLGISYQPLLHPQPRADGPKLYVDGLVLQAATMKTTPHLHVPKTEDAYGSPIRVVCSIRSQGLAVIENTDSFEDIESGYCGAHFYPRQNLYAFLRSIPPEMMPEMASFLPQLYQQVSKRIQGEL